MLRSHPAWVLKISTHPYLKNLGLKSFRFGPLFEYNLRTKVRRKERIAHSWSWEIYAYISCIISPKNADSFRKISPSQRPFPYCKTWQIPKNNEKVTFAVKLARIRFKRCSIRWHQNLMYQIGLGESGFFLRGKITRYLLNCIYANFQKSYFTIF